jgi:hypothetical protein
MHVIRVEYTGHYDSMKYRLIEYQTRGGINPRFRLAELIPRESKPVIL